MHLSIPGLPPTGDLQKLAARAIDALERIADALESRPATPTDSSKRPVKKPA